MRCSNRVSRPRQLPGNGALASPVRGLIGAPFLAESERYSLCGLDAVDNKVDVVSAWSISARTGGAAR
jgi:hypothetical protein